MCVLLSVQIYHERDRGDGHRGGFVLARLGRVPTEGDDLDWGCWRFEVVDMDRRQVDKVLVARSGEMEAADGVTINGAKVVQADIEASNGVIHVIDTGGA